jgi:hypothetical protein
MSIGPEELSAVAVVVPDVPFSRGLPRWTLWFQFWP